MIDVKCDDAILRTFILFVQTAQATLKYADAHFHRKARLSGIQYVVLQRLATNKGTMTPSQIAKWTLKGRNDISALVKRLRRDRLVDVKHSDRDRRSLNVTLTKKGRKVLRQATPVAREIVNQVMSSISEGDAISLEQSLRVLRQNAYRGLEKGHEGEIRKTLV